MIDDFDNVLLPTPFGEAVRVIQSYRTQMVETGSGFEFRNGLWASPRRRFTLADGPHKLSDLLHLKSFFEFRRGRLYGFLLHDWSDDSSTAVGTALTTLDQPLISISDSTTRFALVKLYHQSGRRLMRRIVKPKPDTVIVARNGERLQAGADYTIDTDKGEITLTNPLPKSAKLTAGFNFYVPVRFEDDALEIARLSDDIGQLGPVRLSELRLDREA